MGSDDEADTTKVGEMVAGTESVFNIDDKDCMLDQGDTGFEGEDQDSGDHQDDHQDDGLDHQEEELGGN